jgi:hypothetical protein
MGNFTRQVALWRYFFNLYAGAMRKEQAKDAEKG